MVSHPPSSSDRPANGRTGQSNGHGHGNNRVERPERAQSTPRKDGGLSKEKPVQDPGLKDYVIPLDLWSET